MWRSNWRTGSELLMPTSVRHLPDLFCGERLYPELNVQPDRLHPDRSAIAIVGRVVIVMHVERRTEAANYMRGVVTFPKIFGRVVEFAIAQQKVEPAHCEVDR